MNIVQITPGAGGMYCGNCFRDNALVAALRRQGHNTTMIPLYLPLTLDEEDNTAGTPIFFSGINVYLEQKSAIFRRLPHWLHQWLASPRLLRWASGRAARTRASEVEDLTLSMLRGEVGNQARELEELIGWLQTIDPPDVICLSNALLVGLVRRLKQALRVPVLCLLQGEDSFLDAMNDPMRTQVWKTLGERAREVDRFIAPSRYFGDRMAQRMELSPDRVDVVHNGINLEGYQTAEDTDAAAAASQEPVLGFFARMCPEKGLDTLVDAFIELKRRNRIPRLRLKVGGGCGPGDQPFVDRLRQQLEGEGFLEDVSFHPNLDRAEKQAFLKSISVLSVPALYGEAFGLYLLESWASGVPVVQPRAAAFPELVEDTGGGVLYDPDNPSELADAVEGLLLDQDRWREMSRAGMEAVRSRYNIDVMAEKMIEVFSRTVDQASQPDNQELRTKN